MGSYKIQWKPSALKEVKSLTPRDLPRIIQAVEKLATDPFPPGVRKIQGGEFSYRIRIGQYRIIYQVFEKVLTVEIVRVRHRKEVYR